MRLAKRSGAPRLPAKDRWADVEKTYGHSNPDRAKEIAGKLIAFGVTGVLDLGCGDMKLGQLLKAEGVAYAPADVIARSPECLVVDLNADEVPSVDVECAVMIGVLEFLEDPIGVLRDISNKYRRVLLTLSPMQTIYDQVWHGKPHAIVCNHVNGFGLSEFKKMFFEHFAIEDIDVLFNGQYVILGRSRRLSRAVVKGLAPKEAGRLENQQVGIEDNSINFDFLAQSFEEHIFKSVPFHSMFLRTTAMLGSAVARAGTVCVDIGCSTGRLCRLLRRQLKEAGPVRIVGVDNSREMVAQARKREAHPLTTFVAEDIETYEFPPALVFVSCLFTLQFLEFDARQLVLRRMHDALDWRGCAVVAEKVVECDGKKQMTNHYLLNAYKHVMGFTDGEVLSKERAVRSALRPLTREENLRLFEDAGFERVQVVASAFGWELYLLEKGVRARSA
jgi:tRNA (cmo5U34)-methyltransferase